MIAAPMKHFIAALAAMLTAACAPAWAQALNPDVTQQNIGSTICAPGWAASVRPPASYTARVKRGLLRKAGLPLSSIRDYELDHWVPLALGGAPRDSKNLRLHAWNGPDGAMSKDVLEVRMKREVCAGRVTLDAARQCMSTDWRKCRLFVRKHIIGSDA